MTLGTFLDGALVAGLGHFLVAVDVIVQLIVALTTGTLLFETGAALTQHAKIMIGELKIIFRLDPVARELGIARHALVFFEQLGGIAALAIILPVARLPAEVPPPALSPATASAATLSIVDQMPTSLRSVFKPLRLRQAGLRQGRHSSDPLVPI